MNRPDFAAPATINSTEPLLDLLHEIETLLDRFTHFGVELGLERIEGLLAALGNPQQQVPIVHVAGSNGKGSVCAYLATVLTTAGYRVGRYTSPHLVSWCERICINGQDIAPLELYQLLRQVVAAIRPDRPSPTQFEVITAAAWLYFAQQQVDIAVIEVGLGGRLDATNVCDRPLVSVITSLSREHWQKLGPTLADITREKAGILKADRPAVIAPQPAEATAVLQQRLAALNCPVVWVEPAHDLGDGWAEYQSRRYRLPLAGLHQLTNSAVAIAALEVLQQQGWAISEAQIVEGIGTTQWRGRMQWLTWHDRRLLIDGAHNPAGAEMLRHYLDHGEAAGLPVHWVMGMVATKDHADIFKALLRPGDRLYLVPVSDHLSPDLEQLAALARSACPELSDCRLYADVLIALEDALQAAPDPTAHPAVPVLCGSLYLIGEFFRRMML